MARRYVWLAACVVGISSPSSFAESNATSMSFEAISSCNNDLLKFAI